MLDMKNAQEMKAADAEKSDARPTDLPLWETPKLEDVSEQVMAQPYIRFT